jgi:Lrp/AsnC family transcriptional regulator, leucine-responsive regulatory protein
VSDDNGYFSRFRSISPAEQLAKHVISGRSFEESEVSSNGVGVQIDPINCRILAALQTDCRLSIAELGQLVGLSASACHRRVKQMEEAKLIRGYGAQLDRSKLGFKVEFFVDVSLQSQTGEVLDAFERAVRGMGEILECHLMAGGTDYQLRVVAADIEDYERLHREHLAKLPHVTRIRSNLVIRTVRPWAGYPVRCG